MAPVAGLDLHFLFPGEENYSVTAVETGGEQMSTGHLYLDGFEPYRLIAKRSTPVRGASFWCRWPGSNRHGVATGGF